MRQKTKGFKPVLDGASQAAFTAAEARIRQLIANGRHKAALDQAKDIHKAHRSTASEALLIDAYVARIEDLIRQNLTVEAESLLAMVRERYPAAVDRLSGVGALAAARAGRLEQLAGPLTNPALGDQQRTTIELAIQEQVTDLRALATCEALPPEHPLRKAAASLYQAFHAVTSGPVPEQALALPEVSRRSPLAPWKMLIWAIASLYRRDDEACRRYLDAINPDAAAARLVPAIRCMLNGSADEPLPPASADLVSQVSGNAVALKHAIDDLDQAFDSAEDETEILNAMRMAVQSCRRGAPDQLERLKQHITVRSAKEQLDVDETLDAIGGPARPDAYFYRLFARSLEQEAVDETDHLAACTAWNDFRLKAVEEGWFAPNGTAVATLYLHMAKLLSDVPEDAIRSFEPARRTPKGRSSEDQFFLHADKLYERACVLDPHSEAFSQWMGWAKGRSRAEAERVAEAWHKICPQDIEPVLYLMASHEERGAFPTALQYLAKAERIDGVNPEVRRARLRLLAGQTIRFMQRKKTTLAEQSLKELCELPQTQQGDRPAFVAALRYMIATLEGRLSQAQGFRADIDRLLESQAAAALLIYSIAVACKHSELQRLEPAQKLPKTERAGLPATLVRLARLARDAQFSFRIPPGWLAETTQQFRRTHQTLDVSQLRTLGETALECGDPAFAYAVSAAGLERGGPSEGEFLFMRAQSLPVPNTERRMICAAVAAKLARQHGQHELASKALDFLRGPLRDGSIELTPAQLSEVLKKEKQERSYPKANQQGPKYRSIIGDRLFQSPVHLEDIFDNFGDKEPEFDMDGLIDQLDIPEGIPPAIARLLVGEMMRAIANGESPEEFLARMTGGNGPLPEARGRNARRK